MVEANQSGRFWPSFYEPLRGLGTRLSEWLSPPSEASSDENQYRISIELPGVSEDDIELSVERDVLTVSGEKSESREEKGDTWYFSERHYGSFRRSFRLPADADAEQAEAHAKHGVLEISVPRRTAMTESGMKIQVKKG